MKYLIVGLGNIGPEYAMTRHNAGFRVADALAESGGATFSTERYGDIARMRVKNAQLVILKPSTYMNLSGNAVRYWKEKEGIENGQILIVVDDCALPFGAIRIKPRGSDAGHNGLNSASVTIFREVRRLTMCSAVFQMMKRRLWAHVSSLQSMPSRLFVSQAFRQP